MPAVAVTRTVLDIGCIAGGGGFDEPPQAAKNNDSNMNTTMFAQSDFLTAAAFFLNLSHGNGSRIPASRGSAGDNRAVCL